MATVIANPPISSSLIEVPPNRPPLIMAKAWIIWLQNSLIPRSQQASQIQNVVSQTAQTAAIPTTVIPLGSIPAGYYRLSLYARITTAAGTSSSLTPRVTWTDGAVPQSFTWPALTGNTANSTIVGPPVFFHADANAPINYEAAYVSVGAPAMAYRLDLITELVQ